MLDLEKVTDRSRIDRSYDLRSALHTSRLRLVSHSAVLKHIPQPIQEKVVERVIEKHHHEQVFDETKLAEIMVKILKENQPTIQAPIDSGAVLKAVEALQKQISKIGASSDNNTDMPDIDLEHWADLQSKAIEKLSENVESGNIKSGKKVILKSSKKLDDLANELD